MISFDEGGGGSGFQKIADSRIQIKSTDIHRGKHSLSTLQYKGGVHHAGGRLLGKSGFQELLQKLDYNLALPAGVHSGAHSVRKTHHKFPFLLSAYIIVSRYLLFFPCQSGRAIDNLVTDILYKMNGMILAVDNAAAVLRRCHGAFTDS